MELKLICCICREQIGRFDPDDIKLPLEGHMFKPIDDIHGYPPPFDAKATWNYFHCLRDNNPDKTARHRPFPHRDTILTDKGLYKVGGRLPGPVTHEVPVHDDTDLEKEWNERANPIGPPVEVGTNPEDDEKKTEVTPSTVEAEAHADQTEQPDQQPMVETGIDKESPPLKPKSKPKAKKGSKPKTANRK